MSGPFKDKFQEIVGTVREDGFYYQWFNLAKDHPRQPDKRWISVYEYGGLVLHKSAEPPDTTADEAIAGALLAKAERHIFRPDDHADVVKALLAQLPEFVCQEIVGAAWGQKNRRDYCPVWIPFPAEALDVLRAASAAGLLEVLFPSDETEDGSWFMTHTLRLTRIGTRAVQAHLGLLG